MKSLDNVVNQILIHANGYDYVIINDNSSDNTQKLCEDNNFNVINLPFNLGIGGAMQTGYKFAKLNNYDIAIQIDGDNQHDPSYLNELIAPIISNEADFTIASRFINKEGYQSSFIRQVGIRWLSLLIKLINGVTIKDVTSGYRAANKIVIDYFCKNYPYDYPEPETLCLLGRVNI